MLQVSSCSPVRVLTRMGSQWVMDTIIMNIIKRDMVILMKQVKLVKLMKPLKRMNEASQAGAAEVASECKLIKAKSL